MIITNSCTPVYSTVKNIAQLPFSSNQLYFRTWATFTMNPTLIEIHFTNQSFFFKYITTLILQWGFLDLRFRNFLLFRSQLSFGIWATFTLNHSLIEIHFWNQSFFFKYITTGILQWCWLDLRFQTTLYEKKKSSITYSNRRYDVTAEK